MKKTIVLKYLIIIIALASVLSLLCLAEEKAESDYRIEKIGEDYYLIFDDAEKYLPSGDIFYASAEESFGTAAEIRDKVLNGKLSDYEKRYIGKFFVKDDIGYKIPDFYNMFAPVVPAGSKISEAVWWHNDSYSYHFSNSKAGDGYVNFMTAADFEQSLNALPDNVTDRSQTDGKTVISYEKNGKEYRLERVSYTEGSKLVWIDRIYKNNEFDDILVYISDGNARCKVGFNKLGRNVSDKMLLDFGVTDNIENNGIALDPDTTWIYVTVGSAATVGIASAATVTIIAIKRKKGCKQ